jgi:hypothetical protein
VIIAFGCGSGAPDQNNVDINILATNPHPYLIDHNRVCVIKKEGQEVNRFDLYLDAGSGLSISNLYDVPGTGQFVLIDHNGSWYFIDKTTGELVRQEWHWQKDTPEQFLGTFAYDQETRSYPLIDKEDRPESNIYLVKDPNTH